MSAGGRRMPSEWEEHEATWLQWPCADGASFPGEWTARVEPRFVGLVELISAHEKVRVAVASDAETEHVRGLLSAKARENTGFHVIPTREPWCRDIGPTWVLTDAGGRVAIKWRFNGWGEQWPHEMEDAAGFAIAEANGDPVEEAGIVFEGGGVESDGRGAVMVTEECLLDRMRNPDLTKAEAEEVLVRCLGATRVIWLRGGTKGDDTGHTDVVARFVSPEQVAVSLPDSETHPDYGLLVENRRRLRDEGYQVIELPVLDLEYDESIRDYIPKSYVNFYVFNGGIIVPQFGVDQDARALSVLADCFPDREIVGFDSNDFVYGQGGIHCLTQQVPALA